jgi:hypothetical protein
VNKGKTTAANQVSNAALMIEDVAKDTAVTDNTIADGPAAEVLASGEDARVVSQEALEESRTIAEPKSAESLDNVVETQPELKCADS